MHVIITFIGFKITFSNMGPKTTASLISRGGVLVTLPPLGGREIDTPWEIGLRSVFLDVSALKKAKILRTKSSRTS